MGEIMGRYSNSLKNSPRKGSTTLQYLFTLDSNKNDASNISSPKTGRKTSIESENEEILSIISHCSVIFTFTDPWESPSQQDFKRLKLIQLLSLMKSPKKPLSGKLLRPLVSMLSANLFRPLPSSCNQTINTDLPDDEELVSMLSPTWQHLQFVYVILLRLVHNMDPKILCDYIDQPFLVNLLSLFQSEDPRERESLKNVYHQIYARFTFYRSFMRKSMNDIFLDYVFQMERHSGIGELLEICGSIINGFAVPLREEHKLFLMRVLLPLHKAKGIQVYHRQLSYCVNRLVQKEPTLGAVVVKGILRYWPVTNSQKEILFISELEELVENLDPDHYRKLALPICTQITRCLNSWNSLVAERALYVWNNEQFVKMASAAIEEVLPVVVAGLEGNLKRHWSDNVKNLTENVRGMLEEMDPILYENCRLELNHKEFLAREEEIKRQKRWERIELAATTKNLLLQPQQCMYVSQFKSTGSKFLLANGIQDH